MPGSSSDLEVRFRSGLAPEGAFRAFVADLTDGLERQGLRWDPGPGGRLVAEGAERGIVAHWQPGQAISIEWRRMPWDGSSDARLDVRFRAIEGGSEVEFALSGFAGLFGVSDSNLPAWTAGELIPRMMGRLVPSAVGDWITDRRARRPSGTEARETYRNPTYHVPNFLLLLDRLSLRPDDRLLEVACGGGAFLARALESVGSATGVDHSPELLEVARGVNARWIADGRATLLRGDAAHLPVPSDSFTCCVCTGAIGFFPAPDAALAEMHRALAPGGRLAVFSSSEALRGTPAAPEPIASRVRFFTPSELERLARGAGFIDVTVDEPDIEPYAVRAGIPSDAMGLFRGSGGSLLLEARKAGPAGPSAPLRDGPPSRRAHRSP
jgi:SAM-dependent methyltransferase